MGPLEITLSSSTLGDDKLRNETVLPFGTMVQVVNGDQGWMQTPMGKQAMSADQVRDARESEARQLHRLFGRLESMRFQALGKEDLEGSPCEVVVLYDEAGERIKLFLDPGTHLVRAMENKDQGESGPVLARTIMADVRKEAGWGFARDLKILHDGKLFATYKVETLRVNPELSADLFAEPKP